MKKYVDAKAELCRLDSGDIMLTSIQTVSLDDIDKNEDKSYDSWEDWNS